MHIRALPSLLAAVLSVALSTGLAGAPLAAPAAADTGSVPLGMTTLSRVVLDEARGQLFLSPGSGGTGVRVTDLTGGSARTIDGLSGASGMALTPDGRSLWVALPTAGLARIDTATLEVAQRISLPTGVCPGDVTVVGSRLVYGYSCNTYAGSGGYGGIGVVDAVTGASYGTVTTGPFYRPVVAAGPAGQVYAADSAVSPTGLHLFDVTGAAPVTVAARESVCSNLRDLSASPDGLRVVTACGGTYEHRIYSAPDKLALSGSYPSGSYPLAGAWSADGTTFAAGIDSAYEPDVYVYRQGLNAPARIVDFGGTQDLLRPRGLAVSADGLRVWAVTGTSSSDLALQVLDVPAPDSAQLTASASPGALYPGETTTVTGRLSTVAGASLPGEVLQVSRAATGEAPVPLPSVTTGPDGTYEFRDTPPRSASYVYSVVREADAARAEISVLAWPVEGTLLLDLTRGTSGGTPVYGTVQLYYSGRDSAAGLTATVTRQSGGLSEHVTTLTLDANGGATFTDAPPAGDVTYTVTVAQNGIHPAVTTSRTATVLTATTLTASAPPSAVAGTPLTVRGTLTSPAGPVAGGQVVVSRSGCGTAWSASVTTSSDGAWAATDAPPVGGCTYRASYAGGGGYASSQSPAVGTTVTARDTVLDVATSSAAVAGDPLTVSGRLTSGTAGVSAAGILVTRSGCTSTGWTGQASTAADGSWSVVDKAPPGGTCTYRARFAGDALHAPADRSTTAAVAFRTAGLSVSVTRGTGSTKKTAYVTAQLGTTHTNRTVTITAQPAGGTEVVLASAVAVDSTGRLTVTYTPKTTTTYRVKFAGDAWYAPATVQTVQ